MSAGERRQAIIELLCERRFETRENLASEFGVTSRTIDNDIVYLSDKYPVYTTMGPYGGVHIMDGYRLGRKYLSDKQSEVLESIISKCTGETLAVLESILCDFKKPECKAKK